MVQKIIVCLLFIIGVTLRLYQLDTNPPGLFSDETALAINAKTIAQDGVDEFGRKLPFGFESFSDYKLPGYIYTTSLFYHFLGNTITTVRLPASLAGIASIISISYLTYLLFPKKKYIGLIAMGVLSINLYHIHFSRIAYESMLATFFLSLYLISLVKVLQGKKSLLWVLFGGICATVSMWTYPAPQFIIPVFTLLLLLGCLFFKTSEVRQKNVLTAGIFFLFFIVIFYPLLANPNVSQRPLGYVLGAGGILGILKKCLNIFSSWLRDFNLEFLFLKGDFFGFRHGTRESGQLLPVFILPLFSAIYIVIKQFSVKYFSYLFLLLSLIIFGLPSALTYDQPYGPRLLPMIIPFTILLTLGTDVIFQWINKRQAKLKYSLYIILSFIIVYQLASFTHIYFVHFFQKSKFEFQPAGINVLQFMKTETDKNPQRKIYFLNGEGCMPWAHEELRAWYILDLPNQDMIVWNKEYKNMRDKSGSSFGSFDRLLEPRAEVRNIIFNASHNEMQRAPKGSLLIRCNKHFDDVNQQQEKLLKEFYLLEEEHRDVIYFATEKL